MGTSHAPAAQPIPAVVANNYRHGRTSAKWGDEFESKPPLIPEKEYKESVSLLYSMYEDEMNPATIQRIQHMRNNWLFLIDQNTIQDELVLFKNFGMNLWDDPRQDEKFDLHSAKVLVSCCNCLLKFASVHHSLRGSLAIINDSKQSFCEMTNNRRVFMFAGNFRLESALIDTMLIYQEEVFANSDIRELIEAAKSYKPEASSELRDVSNDD